MPGAVAALQDLGVDPVGQPLTGSATSTAAVGRRRVPRRRPGRGVRRTTLHAALLGRGGGCRRHGRAAGGRRRRAARRPRARRRRPRRATSSRPTACTPAAPRASGSTAGRRRRGATGCAPTSPSRRGRSYVEVHWVEAARGLRDAGGRRPGRRRACSPRRGGRSPRSCSRRFPSLARAARGQSIGEVRGAGPLRQRSRRRVAGRVLLVGDAGGYVDALTGEGIALGVAQARAAVAAIAAGDAGRYEREWRTDHPALRLLTGGAARPPPALGPCAVGSGARCRRGCRGSSRRAVNQLARPA